MTRSAMSSPVLPRPSRLPVRALLHGLVLGIVLTLVGPAAHGIDFRLTTDNDFLTSNEVDDDFYTFSIELAAEGKRNTYALRERAFTNKEDGVRFDETEIVLGRTHLRPGSAWSVRWEAGVTHVGRGLFGQDVQNLIHRLIDSEEVDLNYVEGSDLYPLVVLETGRQQRQTARLSVGPHAQLETALGFKTQLFVGGRAIWQAPKGGMVQLTLGPKLTDASFEPLERHLADVGLAAELVLETRRGLVTTWSLNRYGTRRQHISLGYRIRTERPGAGSPSD